MIDDGVIKYHCSWTIAPPPDEDCVTDLIRWRDRLYQLGLIGVYPNGIGFGNASQRLADRRFLISGTQTGHRPKTTAADFTTVDSWSIDQNTLHCTGPVKASSESLTHAAIYDGLPLIRAIAHGHHSQLWRHYIDVLPTTRADIPYGTPAMAYEIQRLLQEDGLAETNVLVMAGHEDGVIAFGETLQECVERLAHYLALIDEPCSHANHE